MNNGYVLIVEKETILAQGLKVRFEKWGFDRVECASNIQEACSRLDGQPIALAVLGLDSDTRWLEPALSFQQQQPHPVLFLSNFNTLSARRQLKPFGRYVRLSKPCHVPELRAAVESLLTIQLPPEA